MLNEQTFDKLYAMKLIGMAEGLKEQLEQPPLQDLILRRTFLGLTLFTVLKEKICSMSSKIVEDRNG